MRLKHFLVSCEQYKKQVFLRRSGYPSTHPFSLGLIVIVHFSFDATLDEVYFFDVDRFAMGMFECDVVDELVINDDYICSHFVSTNFPSMVLC